MSFWNLREPITREWMHGFIWGYASVWVGLIIGRVLEVL